jgi:hypothetical protein
MYKNEGGAWEILETVAEPHSEKQLAAKATRRRASPPTHGRRRANQKNERPSLATSDVEYVPHFVFNRDHLWRIRGGESRATEPLANYLSERRFWKGFSPSFGASVHESIVAAAIGDRISHGMLVQLDRVSLVVDVNTLCYDPRDHFDFAYVAHGWRLVRERLSSGKVRDLGLAIHSIADFYAHTLYAEFAKRTPSGGIALFDPKAPDFSRCRYDFSDYELPGSKLDRARAAKLWSGNLISGQWWRFYTTFPDDLQNAPDFWKRRCLPDHDAIAVDTPLPKKAHRRYDENEHQLQFALRYQAAVSHVRQAFTEANIAAKRCGGWQA